MDVAEKARGDRIWACTRSAWPVQALQTHKGLGIELMAAMAFLAALELQGLALRVPRS